MPKGPPRSQGPTTEPRAHHGGPGQGPTTESSSSHVPEGPLELRPAVAAGLRHGVVVSVCLGFRVQGIGIALSYKRITTTQACHKSGSTMVHERLLGHKASERISINMFVFKTAEHSRHLRQNAQRATEMLFCMQHKKTETGRWMNHPQQRGLERSHKLPTAMRNENATWVPMWEQDGVGEQYTRHS